MSNILFAYYDLFDVDLTVIFQKLLKTFWRRFARCLEDVLENERLLRSKLLEDVLRTAKCLLQISVSNKSKSVSDKSVSHKPISDESKANPRCNNQIPVI